MASEDKQKEITELETQVVELHNEELALLENPQFKEFLERQNELKSRQDLIWESLKNEMEAYEIKSLKGDWGSITLAERPTYVVSDVEGLPRKYTKKVADVKKIGDDYKLTGKLPAGVEERKTRYLLKKFK